MRNLFTRPDAWTGGYYELALEYSELGPAPIHALVSRLWRHPTLEGCYRESGVEPKGQAKLSPSDALTGEWLCGVATLPNGKLCVCRSAVTQLDDATWVYFGVPLGSLGDAYPVGAFPFEDELPLDWRTAVDLWLFEIAHFVFTEASFRLALVGWLTPVETSAAQVALSGVPEQRWEGYIVVQDSSLEWHKPNQRAPFCWP